MRDAFDETLRNCSIQM